MSVREGTKNDGEMEGGRGAVCMAQQTHLPSHIHNLLSSGQKLKRRDKAILITHVYIQVQLMPRWSV